MKNYDYKYNQKKLILRKVLFFTFIIVGLIVAYINYKNPTVINESPYSFQKSIKCDIISSYSSVEKTLSGEKFISADTGLPVNGILCDSKKTYIINMKDGFVNGMVYTFNKFGELIVETPYINGKKNGISKLYDNNKVTRIVPYKNNKWHGEVKQYYKTGSYIMNYINGKCEGDMILYDLYGTEWARVTYKNNKLISGKCSGGRKWTKKELLLWDKEVAPYITLEYFCNGIKEK